MKEPQVHGLVVIGATAAPKSDELPQFLDPVCIYPEEPETCFVAHVSPWDESPPQLQPLSRGRFEEECETGYWQRLNTELLFRWNYRLVALKGDEPPAYLPAEESYEVVRVLGEQALEAAEQILETTRELKEASYLVWYASRAIPEDPFPMLAAIALGRDRLAPEVLEALEAELPAPGSRISPLLERAQRDGAFCVLRDFVRRDPLGARYFQTDIDHQHRPESRFLEGLDDDPGFFKRFQDCFGFGRSLVPV